METFEIDIEPQTSELTPSDVRNQTDYSDKIKEYGLNPILIGHYYQVGKLENDPGWILYLSSVRTELSNLLNSALAILVDSSVTFKVAKDIKIATRILDGEYGSGNIGKIISVYPKNESEAIQLAKELVEISKEYRGPIVASAHYLGGTVYAAYGESAKNPFILPEGVTWPFEKIALYQPPFNKKLWNDRYKPLEILKEDHKGRVIKGIYFKGFLNIKLCVLKEGNKDMWTDDYGRDITDRLKWQYEIYNDLAGELPTPHLFDYFEQQSSTYLAMEFVKGVSFQKELKNVNESNSWTSLTRSKKLIILEYFNNILAIINKLHQKGYVHRDITPVNFLIDKKGRISLIDMELSYSLHKQKPNPAFKLGSPGFASPEQLNHETPTIKEDIYALGALMIFFVTGLPPVNFDADYPERLLEKLFFFTNNQEINSLIATCLNKDPGKRPQLQSIIEHISKIQENITNNEFKENELPRSPIGNLQLLKETVEQATIGIWDSKIIRSMSSRWTETTTTLEQTENLTTEIKLSSGIYNGIAGILYLQARLKKLNYDQEPHNSAYNNAWDYIFSNHLSSSAHLPASFYDGLAGIALALNEGMQSELLEVNSERIGFLTNCFEVVASNCDIATGIGGQGIALCQCASFLDPSLTKKLLSQYIDILLNAQGKNGSWPIIRTSGRRNDQILGFSHGIAGIVYFLQVCSQKEYDMRIDNSIHRALHWLLTNVKKTNSKKAWAISTKSKFINIWDWSGGTPGVLLTFLKVYECSKEPLYRQIVEDLLSTFPKQPIYEDFTQAHGLAGLGEIYLEAARILQKQEWQERADWIALMLLNTALRGKKNDRYWVKGFIPDYDPGLMSGNGGIVHFLLRHTHPHKLSYPLLPS